MKYIICFFLTAVAFCGCSSSTKKPPVASIQADSLLGNWMIIKVDVTGSNDKYTQLMESIVGSLRNSLELSSLSFNTGGALQVDDGSIELTTGKWSLTADTFRIIHPTLGREDKPFTIASLNRDSLVMQHSFDSEKDDLHVVYIFRKLTIPDSTLNIFDVANNTWRTKPVQPESEAVIRQRLKQMLAYYAAYFAIIQNNKIGYFNREKILVPLMFFDGGLGITPFEDAGNFPDLFYDEADAKKAHALLEKAFSNYEYPDLGNKFVQEYIMALRQISDKL